MSDPIAPVKIMIKVDRNLIERGIFQTSCQAHEKECIW